MSKRRLNSPAALVIALVTALTCALVNAQTVAKANVGEPDFLVLDPKGG